MSVDVSASVEARAAALLARYLRRAQPIAERDELMVRDTWMTAFRLGYLRGGKDCLEQCTELNTALQDRRFHVALATLLQFIDAENGEGLHER